MTTTAVSARLQAAPRRARTDSLRPARRRLATLRELLTAERPMSEPHLFAGPSGPVWH